MKTARETIQHHKTLIEQVRRDHAIESVGKVSEDKIQSHQIELESRDVIEKNKCLYQDAFQRLKGLKSEIEHIKSLMEKRRIRLQKDFDEWYHKMFLVDATVTKTAELRPSQTNDKRTLEKCIHQNESERMIHMNESVNDSQTKTIGKDENTFKLPPSARLTGNKETDDDIIAFYKAKEALHARSKIRFT